MNHLCWSLHSHNQERVKKYFVYIDSPSEWYFFYTGHNNLYLFGNAKSPHHQRFSKAFHLETSAGRFNSTGHKCEMLGQVFQKDTFGYSNLNTDIANSNKGGGIHWHSIIKDNTRENIPSCGAKLCWGKFVAEAWKYLCGSMRESMLVLSCWWMTGITNIL